MAIHGRTLVFRVMLLPEIWTKLPAILSRFLGPPAVFVLTQHQALHRFAISEYLSGTFVLSKSRIRELRSLCV